MLLSSIERYGSRYCAKRSFLADPHQRGLRKTVRHFGVSHCYSLKEKNCHGICSSNKLSMGTGWGVCNLVVSPSGSASSHIPVFLVMGISDGWDVLVGIAGELRT